MSSSEISIPEHIAILILAAGDSSRLGKPKQLLSFSNKPLLQYVIEQAQSSALGPVVVTLGGNASAITNTIDLTNVDVVDNEDWEQGMSSSIRAGLKQVLEKYPSTDAVIVMMCDQPFVSAGLLQQLSKKQAYDGKAIVTSLYDGTMGPPALFHQSIFDELMKLEGDKGAKGVIKQHLNDIATVDFPQGNIDIDTVQDYTKLLQTENKK